jgi:hypothetical protein
MLISNGGQVCRKSKGGKMAVQRAQLYFLIALALLGLALCGCGLVRPQEPPEVDLDEILPANLPPVGTVQRLDVNGDQQSEWLIFYHVDLVEGNPAGSPTVGAVYRPMADVDSRLPPHLVPALLWLPRQGYLCLYNCEAEIRDVVSGDPTVQELVIRDRRGDAVVGAAIFRWQGDQMSETGFEAGRFVPLGHFRGDSVNVELDRVTVIRRIRDRSDLATREVYTPQDGHYYLQPVKSVDDPDSQPRSPQEAEVIFALGPPQEPAQVKLPEKLVMAFYHNFRNLEQVESYVTDAAQDKVVGGCTAETCGCASAWNDISRALVKQIAYETEVKETVSVIVQILCIKNDNQPDPMRTVTWKVRKREDGTWRLIDVLPGGDEYLYPPVAARR